MASPLSMPRARRKDLGWRPRGTSLGLPRGGILIQFRCFFICWKPETQILLQDKQTLFFLTIPYSSLFLNFHLLFFLPLSVFFFFPFHFAAVFIKMPESKCKTIPLARSKQHEKQALVWTSKHLHVAWEWWKAAHAPLKFCLFFLN